MLIQQLQDDQVQALKSHEKDKLSVLRYILAQIQNKKIEKQVDLSDDDIIAVLQKIAKELRESVDAFEKGGRKDLVSEYKKQLDILIPYLPKELTDEELVKTIDELITQNKEIYDKNPKAIIGICMKLLRSKADSSRIMKILSSRLTPNS